jgi:hypothetical protein
MTVLTAGRNGHQRAAKLAIVLGIVTLLICVWGLAFASSALRVPNVPPATENTWSSAPSTEDRATLTRRKPYSWIP